MTRRRNVSVITRNEIILFWDILYIGRGKEIPDVAVLEGLKT